MLIALSICACAVWSQRAQALDAELLPSPAVYRVAAAVDGPVTAVSALAIVLPYAFSRVLITPRCPCNAREVPRFDRRAIGNTNRAAGVLSDVTVGAALALPLLVDGLDLGLSRVWFDDAVVFAETLAINGALVTAAKYAFQRPLPRTYAGDDALLDVPGGYRSFYSGHTSLVFAALSASAMTVRLRYGERYWPWLGTLVVGSSVAVERVADGRHFPSDVMVGALLGTAVGVLVPYLHARRTRVFADLTVTTRTGGVLVAWQRAM